MTVTPLGAPSICSGTTSCASSDPLGLTAANATAVANAGFVSVELQGGATRYGTWSTASGTASNSETYLFVNGIGGGTLTYRVALIGYNTGTPVASSAVLLNGQSYSVLPYAAPTYYSFTQSFTYGQSFQLPLSITMNASWNGSSGESGSRFASARLVDYSVSGEFDLTSAAAVSDVPEPTTAMMWIGGVLLIFFGLRRKPKQR